MKKSMILIVFSLFLFSCEKTPSADICIDPQLIDPEMACTFEYDPVCGCDGKTYPNACAAKYGYGITKFSEGACGCTYKLSGIVKDYTGLDGCAMMIELSDGRVLEPVKLPENFTLKDGMIVELAYREITSMSSICMAGILADVTCIRSVSCLPITIQPLLLYPVQDMTDAVTINKAKVMGDCLEINFSYSGGCQDHQFELKLMPIFCGTPPVPPAILRFLHNANGDACNAYITNTLSYDLTKIQQPDKNSVDFYLTDNEGKYNKKYTYTY